MKQEITLNEHNKQEYPPMHTAGFDTTLIAKMVSLCFVMILCVKISNGQEVPVVNTSDSWHEKYLKLVDDVFGINESVCFKFVARPSFDEEYGLYCNKNSKELVAVRAVVQIWARQNQYMDSLDNLVDTRLAPMVYKMTVSDKVLESIKHLMCSVVETPREKRIGFDGISYSFGSDCGGGVCNVQELWCPLGVMGRIAFLQEEMCVALEFGDKWAVERLSNEMECTYFDLTSQYKDTVDWIDYFRKKRVEKNQSYADRVDAVEKKMHSGQRVTIEEALSVMPKTRDEAMVLWDTKNDFTRRGKLINEMCFGYAMKNPRSGLIEKYVNAMMFSGGLIGGFYFENCYSLWKKYPKETGPLIPKEIEKMFLNW